MARTVMCRKLNKELPGLDMPPFRARRVRRYSIISLKMPGQSG